MAAVAIQADTVESALDQFFRIAALADDDGATVEVRQLQLGDWAKILVRLPSGEIDSVITPPYMEAFLEIQKQLLQFAAFLKSGVANVRELTDFERQQLSIVVKVTEGSSILESPLAKKIEKAIMLMVGKMDGRQATIAILGVSILIGSGFAWNAYLEKEKEVRLQEIKSADSCEAIQALTFANKGQVDTFNRVLDVLDKLGPEGKKAAEVSRSTHEALLKAASKTPESSINGQSLTADEADALRSSPHKKATPRIVQQQMRVVRWDTTDDVATGIVLRNPVTLEDFRITVPDSLFAGETRAKLNTAAFNRTLVWVEALVKELDGEIKAFDFLRVLDKPDN